MSMFGQKTQTQFIKKDKPLEKNDKPEIIKSQLTRLQEIIEYYSENGGKRQKTEIDFTRKIDKYKYIDCMVKLTKNQEIIYQDIKFTNNGKE